MKTLLIAILAVAGTAFGQAPQNKKYNVILLISDQHQRKAISGHGHPIVKTPNIDFLINNGITFNNAYCPSPLCAPSRASLQTGLNPYKHKQLYHGSRPGNKVPGVEGEPGIDSDITVAADLRRHGYITAAIGKMHVHGETRVKDLGFTVRSNRYYTYDYKDYIDKVGEEKVNIYSERGKKFKNPQEQFNHIFNFTNSPMPLEEKDMLDTITTDESIDFIRQNHEKPFFIHVGLERPHQIWATLEKYHQMYDPDRMPLPETEYHKGPVAAVKVSDDQIRHSKAAYYAVVSELDHNIGRIIDEVKRLNLMDNTIFIYTSDHGEMLYEHGQITKGVMYEDSVGIPLIISAPFFKQKGRSCPQTCSLIDLYPTICALLDLPAPKDIDGISLLPAINGKIDNDRFVFSEIHEPKPMRFVRWRNFKYTYTHGAEELLFDIASDPREQTNLVNNTEYKSIHTKLKSATLDHWLPLDNASIASRNKNGIP